MIIFHDVTSMEEVVPDSYKSRTTMLLDGAIMAIESKKMSASLGGIDIGANAAEGAAEEDEESETYIDIVRSCSLQQLDVNKKQFKAATKAYWKLAIRALKKRILTTAGFDDDYEAPADKKAAAAELAEAVEELSEYKKPAHDAAVASLAAFKAHFEEIQNWIKKTVIKNFDEFEFYMTENGNFGEGLLIPARYVGEALAPVFYFYADCLVGISS